MKKILVYLILIILFFLLSINIYILNSNNTLNSNLQNLESITTKVSLLDNVRKSVINLSNIQKSYLLTKDETYKDEYYNYFNETSTLIDNLATENVISNTDKENLLLLLEQYNSISLELFNSEIILPLSTTLENKVLESNKTEIELIHNLTLSIASNTDSSSVSTAALTKDIKNQKTYIQVISGTFTLLISFPLYFFSKKFKGKSIEFKDIFQSISRKLSQSNNYSNVLTYINLLSKHNDHMIEQWQRANDLIISLEKTLDTLKNNTQNNKDDHLQSIEIQLLELKLLTKQLPSYHKYITQLTDSIISNYEK